MQQKRTETCSLLMEIFVFQFSQSTHLIEPSDSCELIPIWVRNNFKQLRAILSSSGWRY